MAEKKKKRYVSNPKPADWMSDAVKKKGSLRKTMKVKKGETIPVAKLKEAAKKRTKAGKMTKEARRAQLALTFKKFRPGKK